MTLNYRLDDEHDAMERQTADGGIAAGDPGAEGFEAAEARTGPDGAPDGADIRHADNANVPHPVPASVKATALSSAAAADIVRSRDLVDVYFHQMGGGEFLTREQEIELAQRIEAGAHAHRAGCRLARRAR
jgi:hypothetical protein